MQPLLEAYAHDGFPVTILKPSTTYGPMQGMLRHIAWGVFGGSIASARASRSRSVARGTPCISTCTSKMPPAAFAQVLGQAQCLGQTYNLVGEPPITWAAYHRTAMEALGREVAFVGVTLAELQAHHVPRREICQEIFAHHTSYRGRNSAGMSPSSTPWYPYPPGCARSLR